MFISDNNTTYLILAKLKFSEQAHSLLICLLFPNILYVQYTQNAKVSAIIDETQVENTKKA